MTTPKLPSAEEFAAEYDEELAGFWKDMTPAQALRVFVLPWLEEAAKIADDASGFPISMVGDKIRKLQDDV